MKKKYLIILVALLLIIGGFVWYQKKTILPIAEAPTPDNATQESSRDTAAPTQTYRWPEEIIVENKLPKSLFQISDKKVRDIRFFGTDPSRLPAIHITTEDGATLEYLTESASLLSTQKSSLNTGETFGGESLLSPQGNYTLVRETTGLTIMTNTTQEKVVITQMDTLPEKCAWNKNEISLICFGKSGSLTETEKTSWKQNQSSLSDQVFFIHRESGDALQFLPVKNLAQKNVSIDAIHPKISQNGAVLIFINKTDMTPWYLNLGIVMEGF
jgi:hypothetical protein